MRVSAIRDLTRPARPVTRSRIEFVLALFLTASVANGQETTTASEVATQVQQRGQELIDSVYEQGNVPGLSAAVSLPDGEVVAFAAGFADQERELPMTPQGRLLSGSIGKTYVAAAALHLAAAGQIDLDDPAIEWFEEDPWFSRVPNAEDFTIRQLLRHQTGIPRHVFHPEFIPACIADPDRVWQPRELLEYILDADAPFAAGEGWSYADTNYIVVGMILERASGVPFYDYVAEHLLRPLKLADTIPTDRRELAGVVQGSIESSAFQGMPAHSLLDDGRFFLNPQFEWCGGGYASTPSDLARWAHLFYGGHAFAGEYLDDLYDGVPVTAGSPVSYGLADFQQATPLGPRHGHDGIMTGYLAGTAYYPDHDIAVAVMQNSDDGAKLGRRLQQVGLELVKIARDALSEASDQSR